MTKLKKIIPFLIFVISFFGCGQKETLKNNTENGLTSNSQLKYPLTTNFDTLRYLLKTLPSDTNRLNVLSMATWRYLQIDPDTALILAKEAFELSGKFSASSEYKFAYSGKKGLSNYYGNMGIYFYNRDEYEKAIENFLIEVKIDKELNRKGGLGRAYGLIANVYKQKGDFPLALDFYLKALKKDESGDIKAGISTDLGNLGIVYKLQGDYPKALEYYSKALKMDSAIGNKNGIARHLGNIGNVYYLQQNYTLARKKLNEAFLINREIGNKNGMGINLASIAGIIIDQGKTKIKKEERDSSFRRAVEIYKEAIKIAEELKNKNLVAIWSGNIGSLYITEEKYAESFSYLYRTLAIEDSLKLMDPLQECYQTLSFLYERSSIGLPDSVGGKRLNPEQMRLRSLYYFKTFVNLKDSVFSQENKKQILRKQLNFDFEKKEAVAKAEQNKKDALADEQLKQKEQQRNYFIAGFALVLLLAGFIFRGYRQKQKANKIISDQKYLVEEKQKEILDSIRYAKRIQSSILPTEKYIDKNFNRLKK